MRFVDHDEALRDHLVRLLTTPWAHATFASAAADLPERARSSRPEGFDHTAWQLLEHLRIAQADLLDYSRNPGYTGDKAFPDDYWPKSDGPPDAAAWETSVASCRADLEAMVALVKDPATDLFAPLPWSRKGHTVLREALILADHNAYHVGQLVQLRRALGAWKN